MRHERVLTFVLTTTLICVLAAHWLAWGALADGAVWEYAVQSSDYSGLKAWLLSAYWYIPYAIVLIVKWLVQTGWSHVFVIKFLITFLLLGYVFEVKRWCSDVFRFEDATSNCCAVLVLLVGPWYTLVNYFAISQLLCLYLGLLGNRLIWKTSAASRSTGLLLCIASFQLSSNFVFVLALQAVRMYTQPKADKKMWLWTFALLCSCIAAYLFLKLAVPKGVIHTNYNELLLPTSFENLARLSKSVIMFGTWGIVPLAALLAALVVQNHPSFHQSGQSLKTCTSTVNKQLFLTAFLVVSAIFPYVMVGKGFALFAPTFLGQGLTESVLREAYAGWFLAPTYSSTSSRHALMLSFPLVVLSVLSIQKLALLRNVKLTALHVFLFIAPIPILFTVGGYFNKLSQLYVHEQLVSGLKKLPPPPAGLISLAYKPTSDWMIWVPDGNLIVRRAWLNSSYYTMMHSTLAYEEDLKWGLNSVYKAQLGGLEKNELQAMHAMKEYPGEACLTKYQANLPDAKLTHVLFAHWLNDMVVPADVKLISSECVTNRVIQNPTPNKKLIP